MNTSQCSLPVKQKARRKNGRAFLLSSTLTRVIVHSRDAASTKNIFQVILYQNPR